MWDSARFRRCPVNSTSLRPESYRSATGAGRPRRGSTSDPYPDSEPKRSNFARSPYPGGEDDARHDGSIERKLYASSEGVGRGFCGDCGTTLTWEGDGEELGLLVEIHMGTLDDPNVHAPKCHVHHDERIAWFDAAGSLPRYHEWEVDEGPYRSDPAV